MPPAEPGASWYCGVELLGVQIAFDECRNLLDCLCILGLDRDRRTLSCAERHDHEARCGIHRVFVAALERKKDLVVVLSSSLGDERRRTPSVGNTRRFSLRGSGGDARGRSLRGTGLVLCGDAAGSFERPST